MATLVMTYKNVPFYALGAYYKTSSPKHDLYSRQILDFKDGKQKAVDDFANKTINLLARKGLKNQSVYVATVPSSTAGNAHNGFPELIKQLAGKFNIQNPNQNLIARHTSKQKAHKGGSRKKVDIINTLTVPQKVADTIAGKSVILLDDVTTTTNSLQACTDILLQAKARVVVAIVMGRTSQ